MMNALKDLRDRLAAAQDRHRALREIAAMDAQELEDLGLDRVELIQLASAPGDVTERMEAMARRHGIAPETLQRLRRDYAHLVDACAHCSETGLCAAYLADAHHGPMAAGFCPNHKDFLELRGTV